MPGVSDQGQGNEETPAPWTQLVQDVPSFSGTATHTDKNEEIVIAGIRATDVAFGLRRVPAGFYAVVRHSGLEWRTENKRSSVSHDVVEWNGSVPIPSDLSATVCIEVCGSFELQPIWGAGEQLRELTITVQQLLDCSAKDAPFTFFPMDGDVVTPCSSISVTVKRQKCESSDPSGLKVLDPHCSTTESRGELEDATNNGHSALSHYRKHGEKRDLERSIEQFEHALSICPLDHSCLAAAQSNLAMVKLILCQAEHMDASLEVPLGLYRNALAARPVGHLDRPSTLVQLAVVHFARFEKQGDEGERALAEALLYEAMELSSTDSHENRAAAFMLQLHAGCRKGPVEADDRSSVEQDSAIRSPDEERWSLSAQLVHRFQQFGHLADLQQAITLLEELVRSTSTSDDRYSEALGGLGLALSYRFDHVEELSDLEEALSRQRNAVDLTPQGHPLKPRLLQSLGSSFMTRFERLGELSDLENAISNQRDAVNLTPHGHPDKPRLLNNLGNSFITRFQRLGELSDLEEAILRYRDAVDLIPHGHPQKPAHLNSLGSSFRARFERLGELGDLEDAISTQRHAVDLTPHDHPDKPRRLNNLGNSFLTRFERLGELGDLELAISTYIDAVDLTPHGHPDKPSRLNNLGGSFKARFERLGELSDLGHAVSTYRDAADLILHGHPHKPGILNNLGSSFKARFERLGELSDLEEAISALKDAVDLTPHGHPHKPVFLTNLGSSFFVRFERLGELSDLEDAISTLRGAVDLTPQGHPQQPDFLNNLGNSFLARFERLEELSDLEGAISMQRDAVNLIPRGHPGKPAHLNSLGNSLFARFERLGELTDLEGAISAQMDAVDLTPHDHPDKPRHLSNLGNSFLARFERLREFSDLEVAILRHRDAVDLTPHGHPDKSGRLNNLGNSFRARFERLGELSDLEDSISTLRDAVDLTPDGHPHKFGILNTLGISFFARFASLGELNDLEAAILRHRDAVDLTPRGHPREPSVLNNLGSSFFARFERLEGLSDLEEAISRQRDAVELTPHGHPRRPDYLYNLGNSLRARFELLGELGDIEQAISQYFLAASAPIGSISIRFRASQNWISCARHMQHPSLLDACSVSITLLPQLAWIGLSLPHRYTELTRGVNVVREAAAAALDLGLPETAVEWLEQGRSIVWGELFQLRSSYEELSSAHPDHARRLRELSVALEHASAAREKSLSALSEQSQSAALRATESLQHEADRHRTLATERDKLLHEIRGFPSFERFLLHKEFSRLRPSAHSGPIVILNAAETRCDALIVLADVDHVIHVPLPSFTFKRSAGLQKMVEKLLGHARVIRLDEREGDRATRGGISWESLLSILWKDVVKPVLHALAFTTAPGDLSRIFWCPTGPFVFLPIHAAGLYDTPHTQPGHRVFDIVVSSYVTTLAILAPSPNPSVAPSGDLRLLTVRQPPSDGLSHLPGVDTELGHIREVIRNSPSAHTTLMESSDGTVEEVLSLMKEADWVHFACHGIQDAENPANSGLCLADGRRLKLRNIIALSRPHGGLAFLSACQTAMGNEYLSDESIHVAAGMLLVGYGGVVGTMWSISDSLAPRVARDVYGQLFRNGTMARLSGGCASAARSYWASSRWQRVVRRVASVHPCGSLNVLLAPTVTLPLALLSPAPSR
ncbi:TPR-like protein [Boletus coccyginus]|nr:TPR-like protein [Boletus coccyginus]